MSNALVYMRTKLLTLLAVLCAPKQVLASIIILPVYRQARLGPLWRRPLLHVLRVSKRKTPKFGCLVLSKQR